MKFESWTYKVFADLTLDRSEIELLSRAAEAHYDATCRAASVPGRGAFLNGFRNLLDEKAGTATHEVSSRDIGIMLKILEMPPYLSKDEEAVRDALVSALGKTLRDMESEWLRLNGS